MTRSDWIRSFVLQLRLLGVKAEEQALDDMASTTHAAHGTLDPKQAADAEWAIWPPRDNWGPSAEVSPARKHTRHFD